MVQKSRHRSGEAVDFSKFRKRRRASRRGSRFQHRSEIDPSVPENPSISSCFTNLNTLSALATSAFHRALDPSTTRRAQTPKHRRTAGAGTGFSITPANGSGFQNPQRAFP
jgi:hypothetical protein